MAKHNEQELQTFLSNGTKYQVVPGKGKDAEQATSDFDPFAERKIEHPVTDNETLTHLLKAALGSGILTMPLAFLYTGLVTGIFMTIITAVICTHCAYVLVQCAQTLYYRHRITKMGFSETVVVALREGPEWGRKYSTVSKYIVEINLFVTYFGTGAVYMVIVVENIKGVIEEHVGGGAYDVRICLMVTLIPVILFSWVPNLKYLAPFSMMANLFMLVGLGITMYYLSTDLPPISERNLHSSIFGIPHAVAIVIFAMEAIGVVMPLENQMKTPKSFVGVFGVLNRGMAGVTIFYLVLGFLGYWKYGTGTLGAISLNLPNKDILAQAVKVLIGLAVFFTFGLQFYVCIDIGWSMIKDKFTKRPTLVNYVMRTVLATLCVLVAVAVPTIGPFVGLIGAFCFSILGLLVPVLIQTVVFWDQGFGKFNWIIWKNVVVVIFGIMALIFGSMSSIKDIIRLYTEKPQ